MFKITPVQNKQLQKDICAKCGAKYREEAFAYQMFDMESGDLMGMSQFEIDNDGYIYDLREVPGLEDFEAMFILGRQTMNFIDSCGAHICYSDNTAGDKHLLKSIGFKEQEGKLFVNMEGMFDGNCGNH